MDNKKPVRPKGTDRAKDLVEKLMDLRDMALAVFLWVFVYFLLPALMSGITAVVVTTLFFFLKKSVIRPTGSKRSRGWGQLHCCTRTQQILW